MNKEVSMPVAVWFWLAMVLAAIYAILYGIKNRPAPPYGPFYWGVGLVAFFYVLFLFVGFTLYPDPFKTLVH